MELTETTAPSESQTVEVVLVDIERPFMDTSFLDYSVSEGLLLLIFVLVFLNFILNLLRR